MLHEPNARMRLIYANQPGTPVTIVREFTSGEAHAIAKAIAQAPEPQVDNTLGYLWQRHWWLACGCRAQAQCPPLLYVHRQGERFALRRMTDRSAHAKNCPCAKVPDSAIDAEETPDSSHGLRGLSESWFKSASLNLVYPYTPRDSLARQFGGLREVMGNVRMDTRRMLSGFASTHPREITDMVARLVQDHARAIRNGRNHEPAWGVAIDVVDRIGNGAVRFGQRDIVVRDEHVHMAQGTRQAGGPYAVLVRYRMKDTGAVGPDAMYVQSVHSRGHLVPIDYAHERDTLKIMLSMQRKIMERHGVITLLRKTLPGGQRHARGIGFQIQRLGPNGRSTREIDVLSTDVTALEPDRKATARQHPQNVVYHLVRRPGGAPVGPHDPVSGTLDEQFYNIMSARLLEDLPRTREPARAAAAAV